MSTRSARTPAAESGNGSSGGGADGAVAADWSVAVDGVAVFQWAVEVDYDARYGRFVAEGKRVPYDAQLPEIVARFRYLRHAQAFVIREYEDDPKLVARVKFERF